MTKTAILKDDLFLAHDPGYDHVESPSRLAVIYEELRKPAVAEKFIFPPCQPASKAILAYNHTALHIKRVAATAGQAFNMLDPDTRTSPESYAAACLAAGAVVEAARLLHAGEADNCFALVRPPGHHAEPDQAMGFCLFNNIAMAAHYAINDLGLKRILIVDWDLHHGNGTQHSFYDTNTVLYFSSHQYPYYPGSGALTEAGAGKGEGYTVNIPLPGGQDDLFYAAMFNQVLAPIARQYKPEMIMVSAGYDIYHADPLGGMAVTTDGFAYLTKVLLNLAAELCGGRLLLTLEGGYNLTSLREGVLATLLELTGASILTPEKISRFETSALSAGTLDTIKRIIGTYWIL